MNIPEIITILNAYAEGKPVEFKVNEDDAWRPIFNLEELLYHMSTPRSKEIRIAPAPQEYWMNVYGCSITGIVGVCYKSKEAADKLTSERIDCIRLIPAP